MKCTNCGAALDDAVSICPECGNCTDSSVQAAPEIPAEAEKATAHAAEPASKKRGALIALICVAAALVVAVGALIFLLVSRSSTKAASGSSFAGAASDASFADAASVSYIIEDANAFNKRLLNRKIATCGESTLTNEILAYYYWSEFYSIVSNASNLTAIMADPYANLSTQLSPEGITWDETIMNYAIKTYATCAAASQQAKAEGFPLPEAAQAALDSLDEDFAAYAQAYGYETADEYLQLSFGPYCTLDSYRAYLEEFYLASAYLNAQLDNADMSAEALGAFFDKNAEKYEASGIIKDDSITYVNVRHILIKPEAVELSADDEGYEEAVAEAKAAAKATAEALYQEWLDGEATEDSFAALASEHTQDIASASKGGFYENVYPKQMVTEFNDWCFDASRQTGDSGIVESSYGFHLMYFSEKTDTIFWQDAIKSDYVNSLYNEICDSLVAAHPTEVDLTHAAVYSCNTVPLG